MDINPFPPLSPGHSFRPQAARAHTHAPPPRALCDLSPDLSITHSAVSTVGPAPISAAERTGFLPGSFALWPCLGD